jgi:hypothetical protein
MPSSYAVKPESLCREPDALVGALASRRLGTLDPAWVRAGMWEHRP